MGTVELTVDGNHLRLEPQPELQPAFMRGLGHARKTVRQFREIDLPVTERRVVIVAVAEPAVVEHEHFEPEVCRTGREVVDFRLVKGEIRGLPVVHEDGPQRTLVFAAHEMLADEAMERLAHAVQACRAIAQPRLRRLERLARCKVPVEFEVTQSRHDARRAKLLHLGAQGEVAAPHKVHAVNLTLLLRRLGTRQREERRRLM